MCLEISESLFSSASHSLYVIRAIHRKILILYDCNDIMKGTKDTIHITTTRTKPPMKIFSRRDI